MVESKGYCGECENNCCFEFKLHWSHQQVQDLIGEYPFFEMIETGVDMVGGKEKVYRKIRCSRLQADMTCRDYPNNRPKFCENTGVISRPALNCLLHDFIISQQKNEQKS